MPGEPTRYGVKLASHFIDIPRMLELARHAEARGYHSVWTTEGRMAPDSVTLTAAIAATTRRVRVGTSVVNPFTRSPGLVAITAASIDRISAGRFVLGIGTGDPASLDKQHIDHSRPVTRLREYVTVMRDLWSGKPVDFSGETLRISDLTMDFTPHQDQLPVYVAATGPRALTQAGDIGDGILLNIGVGTDAVAKIAETAHSGRHVDVVGSVVVGMDRDPEVAVRGTKPLVVTYLTRFPAIARVSGVPDSVVQELQLALSSAGMEAACAALPDRCVHRVAAVGTPADCQRWIREYVADLDEALLTPAFGDPGTIIDELAGLITP